MNEATRYASLRDYLRVLRSQWWVIAAIALVAGVAAYVYSSREEESYEAGATMSFVTELQELNLLGDGVAGEATAPADSPVARASTLDRPEIVRGVKRELSEPAPSLAALRGAVNGAIDEDSGLVRVTVTWGNAKFAAKLANLFAKVGAEYINRDARARFDRTKELVQRQLSDLGNSPEDNIERAALVNQLTRVRFLSTNTSPATVVEKAEPPASPVSPQPIRDTVIAVLLGLSLGVLVAFLRDSLDRRLRDSGEIRQELSYPVIGHVRDELMGKAVRAEVGGGNTSSDDLEGFRILRRNLDFLAVDSETKLILVTSALPEEGKSTVAGSLAYASAASGSPTLLLECDLRRPSLAERMGIRATPGLTDHLASHRTFEEVSQVARTVVPAAQKRKASAGGTDAAAAELGESLIVVSAGTPSPQPTELLHSNRMRVLLDSVSASFETIVIDSSPLLPVADTLELLPLVDCVVLCVRAGQTTRDQARAAAAVLERFPERPTGLVVTGLRKRDASGYGYYSYSYAPRGVAAGA